MGHLGQVGKLGQVGLLSHSGTAGTVATVDFSLAVVIQTPTSISKTLANLNSDISVTVLALKGATINGGVNA